MQPAVHADAPVELDHIAHQLDAGSRVVHFDGSAADPRAAAESLLAAALGVRPTDPLFAFSAYLLHLRSQSERLVVVIDDVAALATPTAQWLRATLDESAGTFVALARAADAAEAERAAARFGLPLVRPASSTPLPAWSDAWLGFGGSALLAAALAALALGLQ